MSLLIDTRLLESLGTWRTYFRTRFSEIIIEHFPAIGEKLPSAIQFFKVLEHGKYVLNT